MHACMGVPALDCMAADAAGSQRSKKMPGRLRPVADPRWPTSSSCMRRHLVTLSYKLLKPLVDCNRDPWTPCMVSFVGNLVISYNKVHLSLNNISDIGSLLKSFLGS